MLYEGTILAAVGCVSFAVFMGAFGGWDHLRRCAVQKSCAVMAVVNRHKPYNATVWNETDPETLLWRVGGLIGRSGSAVCGLFDFSTARLCMMAYIAFRVQDTWADVAIESEDRIRGLRLLPERYGRIDNGEEVPQDDVENVRWDTDTRERNRLYVDVTKNVHRFDPVYRQLSSFQQEIIREFARDIGEGWAALELLKDTPVTPQLMRQHAYVALDVGYFGLVKGVECTKLLTAIQTDEFEPASHRAFIKFSDYIWYLNLVASIEEDVAEGVALDPELQAMKKDDPQQDVMDRVRVKWLILAIEALLESRTFLFHPALVENWVLRLFTLQFFQTSVNVCEKYYLLLNHGRYEKKKGALSLMKTFLKSMTRQGYLGATENGFNYSKILLEGFRAIQGSMSCHQDPK